MEQINKLEIVLSVLLLLVSIISYIAIRKTKNALTLLRQENFTLNKLYIEASDDILEANTIVHEESKRKLDLLERLQIVHNASHDVFKLNRKLVNTGSLLQVKLPIGATKAEILEAFADPKSFEEFIEVDQAEGTANIAVIRYSDLINWFSELVEANTEYMKSFSENKN